MRLTKLLEDIDDKDEFERDCNYCRYQNEKHVPDIENFHTAHSDARQHALSVGMWGTEPYKNKYKDVMLKHGYEYRDERSELDNEGYWEKVVSG